MKRVSALVLLAFCGFAVSSLASAQTSTAPVRPVLIIQSTPGGVQVYVDDELLGTTSPEGRLKISTLKPGKHTLRVSLGGNTYGQGEITLVAGKSLTKAVTLPEHNAAGNPAATRPENAGNGAAGASTGGPSLADTLGWIRDTLQNDPGAGYSFSIAFQVMGANGWGSHLSSYSLHQEQGCQVVLVAKDTAQSGSDGIYGSTQAPYTASSTYSLDLSEVDPKSVSSLAGQTQINPSTTISGGDVTYSQLLFKATGNRLVFDRSGSAPSKSAIFDAFRVRSPETAARLVNAFKHAIELCGGKPSAF
jgi:hypothetical protein